MVRILLDAYSNYSLRRRFLSGFVVEHDGEGHNEADPKNNQRKPSCQMVTRSAMVHPCACVKIQEGITDIPHGIDICCNEKEEDSNRDDSKNPRHSGLAQHFENAHECLQKKCNLLPH